MKLIRSNIMNSTYYNVPSTMNSSITSNKTPSTDQLHRITKLIQKLIQSPDLNLTEMWLNLKRAVQMPANITGN